MDDSLPELSGKHTEKDEAVHKALHVIHRPDKYKAVSVANQILENRIIIKNNLGFLIDYMKEVEYYYLREKIARIVLQTAVISDKPNEDTVRGLSYLVNQAVIDTRTKSWTEYENINYKFDFDSIDEIIEEIEETTGISDLDCIEGNDGHKLVDPTSNDIIAEFTTTEEFVNIRYYNHIKKYIGRNHRKNKLLRIGLEGLIWCCKKEMVPDERTISSIEKIAQSSSDVHIRDLSLRLLYYYIDQNPEYFYNNEDTVIHIFISNNSHNKVGIKYLSRIIQCLDVERIQNKERISDHLKNKIFLLVGGDKKICRRAISDITGESKIRLYFNEVMKNTDKNYH